MGKSFKIALLDLNHNTRGIHTNTVPLGLGFLASYLKQNMNGNFDIKMFKSPQKARKVFRNWVPDVAGLAQYCWNSELNLYFSRLIKKINSECLVVAGGPNLDISKSQRKAFLERNPFIDLCVLFDGEIPFTEVIRHLLGGQRAEDIRKAPVAGSYALNPETGKLAESLAFIPHLESLDKIGAVYIDGLFNELLDDGFHPFVQTHRGCPFSCSFCHTSDKYYSQMLFLSPEIFRKDMEYLGKRFCGMHNIVLYMANTNMSLFKEDFAIAEVIRQIQKKYDWPKLINVNSGKDPDKLLKMLSIIDFRPTIALQTLTDSVLKNIGRKNIPFDKFMDFQNAVSQKTGKQTSTELILCLPGETKESFLKTLRQVMNSGIQNIVIYTLMHLKGTPLSTEENKKRYGYDIRHRVVPRQFSRIEGETILDTEEVIVATNSMSYDDYLQLRGISFVVMIFFNSAELIPLKKFLSEQAIDIAKWVFNIHDNLKDAPEIYKLYRAFLEDTQNELFPSRDALVKFFSQPKNYRALCSGELGDNLLRKYKCIVLSKYFESFLDLAISEARKLSPNGIKDVFLDLKEYISYRDMKKYFTDSPTHRKRVYTVSLNYDIHSWLNNNSLRLEDSCAACGYMVSQPDTARRRFKNIMEINKDFELSLQMLYRDGIISEFWPEWTKKV